MNDLKYYEKLFSSELKDYCIPFWLNNGVDKEYGGLINCLDRDGKIYSYDKSVWMQGRCGYTFSYIYNNIEKKQEYLDMAKSAIDFARNHCIDSDKRMFFTVTREGFPIRKRRYFFSETFYIIANMQYYKATKDEKYLNEGKKYFDFVWSIYIDPENDPYKITPKYISSTRDMKSLAVPMILLNVCAVMKECDEENIESYEEKTKKLIKDIKCFYNEKYGLMFENVTTDNRFLFDNSSSRVINPGHSIECSWFLLEEGIKSGDKDLIEFARKIFDNSFNLGWDKENGGIIYFKDVLGYPVEAYEHDMKLWWPQNETMISSLMLYLYTKEQKYYEIFEKVTEYAFKYFSDREHGGEWLGYLRFDNKPTMPPCKGHTYKGPFHVMRCLAKCLDMMKKNK